MGEQGRCDSDYPPAPFGKTLTMSMLEDGVRSALQQIEEKQYEPALLSRGIAPERIRKYGFAFEGSSVLIGRG